MKVTALFKNYNKVYGSDVPHHVATSFANFGTTTYFCPPIPESSLKSGSTGTAW
jgi:hypothetical protein